MTADYVRRSFCWTINFSAAPGRRCLWFRGVGKDLYMCGVCVALLVLFCLYYEEAHKVGQNSSQYYKMSKIQFTTDIIVLSADEEEVERKLKPYAARSVANNLVHGWHRVALPHLESLDRTILNYCRKTCSRIKYWLCVIHYARV